MTVRFSKYTISDNVTNISDDHIALDILDLMHPKDCRFTISNRATTQDKIRFLSRIRQYILEHEGTEGQVVG